MPAARLIPLLVLAGAAVLHQSCGVLDNYDASPQAKENAPINTGLSKLGSRPATPALHPIQPGRKTAAPTDPVLNLSEVFDKAAPRPRPAPSVPPPPAEAAPNTGLSSAPAEPAPPGPAPAASAEQRVAAQAADLRKALQERATLRPFTTAFSLTLLDALSPAGQSDPGSDLAPSQRRVIGALRSVLASLTGGSASDGDPGRVAELLEQARQELATSQAVRIARVVLCKRVSGFGRYEPFPSTTFAAGKTNRVLVYVEVENFAHRAAREGDPGRDVQAGLAEDPPLWTVELGQELWMTHDSDGTTQWRRAEETITEVGRNRRRDFYLVQQIDLPATLSVGRFNLKVILRDKTSGATDEHIVPLTIVADEQTAMRAPSQFKPKPAARPQSNADRR